MILFGNCLVQLKVLPDNSVDSIVTDPPYGLAFMGKKWDYEVPSVEIWQECLRVLKPGGHLLSFGGTRTYHRMVVNIEDAGFEIRDQIMWIYGSGFPKSTNVALRIDKESGAIGNRGKGFNAAGQGISLNQNKELPSDHPDYVKPEFKTESAKQWQGWGTALKPANEPIVVARKPLEKGLTVAANVLKYGTGAMNIDASRIGAETIKINKHQGYNSNSLNGSTKGLWQGKSETVTGRWPANILFDEAAAELLDAHSGQLSQCGGPKKTTHDKGMFGIGVPGRIYQEENRGASRFFYVAKASKNERGTDNNHPTVKPIKLMQYLINLVTPLNGTILDPFMGSGSTGVAAKNLGFNFIGCEMNEEYLKIAEKRIENAL